MGYVYLAVPVSGVFIIVFCLERIVELLSAPADGPSNDSDAQHEER